MLISDGNFGASEIDRLELHNAIEQPTSTFATSTSDGTSPKLAKS